MQSSNHIVTIIICCLLTWAAASTREQNFAKIRLETGQNRAYNSGVIAGHNEAFNWLVNQCKKGTAWAWEGDDPPIHYVCSQKPFEGQTKVDFVEWRPYIVMDDMF